MKTLKIYTVVHPVPADNPWGAPEGWRWAIHTDLNFHQVAEGCINASWQPSQADAESELSLVLITARRALTCAGVKSKVEATVHSDCPLTADIAAELAVLL